MVSCFPFQSFRRQTKQVYPLGSDSFRNNETASNFKDSVRELKKPGVGTHLDEYKKNLGSRINSESCLLSSAPFDDDYYMNADADAGADCDGDCDIQSDGDNWWR